MPTRSEVNAATKLLQDDIDAKIADRQRILDAYSDADDLDDLAQVIEATSGTSWHAKGIHYTPSDATRAAFVTWLQAQAVTVRASVVVPEAPARVDPG